MPRSASTIAATAAIVLGVSTSLALAGGSAPPTAAEVALLAAPPRAAQLASERLYFVMPDRYDNGDSTNDRGGADGPRGVTGFDPTDTGWYHGGDLTGLTGGCDDPQRGLGRVKALGFTGVWVTPPFGQRWVQGSSAAYHGYWIQDFTSVDPHLGTNDDFAAFADCAHRLGLKLYLDVVVNHTADVITPSGRTFIGPADVPYRDCRGKAFVPARFAFGRTFPCLAARYMPRPPLVLAADKAAKKPAWLNDPLRYHNRGDIDFAGCSEVCFEQGDFFGLDDLFTEQPRVADGLAEIYADWIRRYRIDGFRVDTAKHVNVAFFKRWVPKLRAAARAAGVPGFQLFGEVFVTDSIELAGYVRNRGIPEVLDFPLQDALVRYAGGSAGSRGIATRFADDDYFRGASGMAPGPATFLGNHDIGRAARQVDDQTSAVGAQLLERVLLAHDLLYLLRGAPVVMYGDEVGIVGRGGDKEARQDLFPTKVPGWRTEARIGSPPIGTRSSFDVVGHPIAERLKVLSALRDANPALEVGSTHVRAGQGTTLIVSRIDPTARRELVVGFNQSDTAVTATVSTATPSASWTPLLGGTRAATGTDGRLRLTIPKRGTVVLRADEPLPDRAAVAPSLRMTEDPLTGLRQLTATVRTTDPVSVGFAIRRGGGSWKRVAADDAPPYRAFLDPVRFRKREAVEVIAVLRASNGSTASSPVLRVVPRRG